jgi:hypothetical protein
MKTTSPLVVALVDATEDLRARAFLLRRVKPALINGIWPGNSAGFASSQVPLRAWAGVYLTLSAVVKGLGEFGTLEDRSRLVLDALNDSPVPIQSSPYAAYAKSYRCLQLLDDLEIKSIKALPARREIVSLYVQRLSIATFVQDDPGFAVTEKSPHAWMADLAWTDGIRYADALEAHSSANQSRCEALLNGPMELADPEASDHVPAVFRKLSAVTGIHTNALMSGYSYAWCLAVAEIADALRNNLTTQRPLHDLTFVEDTSHGQ